MGCVMHKTTQKIHHHMSIDVGVGFFQTIFEDNISLRKNNGKMLQRYGLWLDDSEFNVCQINVLYGKSPMAPKWSKKRCST